MFSERGRSCFSVITAAAAAGKKEEKKKLVSSLNADCGGETSHATSRSG